MVQHIQTAPRIKLPWTLARSRVPAGAAIGRKNCIHPQTPPCLTLRGHNASYIRRAQCAFRTAAIDDIHVVPYIETLYNFSSTSHCSHIHPSSILAIVGNNSVRFRIHYLIGKDECKSRKGRVETFGVYKTTNEPSSIFQRKGFLFFRKITSERNHSQWSRIVELGEKSFVHANLFFSALHIGRWYFSPAQSL